MLKQTIPFEAKAQVESESEESEKVAKIRFSQGEQMIIVVLQFLSGWKGTVGQNDIYRVIHTNCNPIIIPTLGVRLK